MTRVSRRLPLFLLAACAAASPARASMDEAWLSRAATTARPLLVLLDNASDHGPRELAVAPAYDPSIDYAARLAAGPACDAGRVYWRRGPGPAPDCASGPSVPLDAPPPRGFRCETARAALESQGVFVASRAAQWQDAPGGGGWRELRAGADAPVECRADGGRHGASRGAWFAAQGSAGPWSADPRDEIDWDAPPLSDAYVFFAGNYLNYLAGASRSERLQAPQALERALVAAAGAGEGLDLALLRPSAGGVALRLAPTPLPAAASLREALAAPVAATEDGPAAGALADWLSADPRAFSHACRAVSAALLAPATAAACADGRCLEDPLGRLSGGDLVADLPGAQRAPAWIVAAPGADAGLVAAARATGTPLLDLGDPLALVMLIAHALQRDAGEPAHGRRSAPALSSSAAGEPDRFESVGRPQARPRWPGTVERLVGPEGRALFDAGARLPSPPGRNVVTDLSTADLGATAAAVDDAVSALGRVPLGLSSHDPATLADLAAWVEGGDALDEDGDGDRSEARLAFGDPGVEPPVVLRYAGEPVERRVFVATGDGLVHALDGETGRERWVFLPAAGLAGLRRLADTAETRVRSGRPGALRASFLDLDGDGAVDATAGERASLLLAMGGGARGYAALDVTRPDRPRVSWSIDTTGWPALGETLSPPLAARMRIDAARQGGDLRVAVLTGGYDPLQRARGAAADAVGGRLAIVSVGSGEVLWQAAARDGAGVDLVDPGLTASFAASPRAVDTDGDGLADRIYALDVAGRLWRFDFAGTAPSAVLLARLGLAGGATGAADARRFHWTPDVVYLRDGASARLAIAFGSGFAERPRDATVADRFYVVFDPLGADAPPGPLAEEDLADVTDGTPPPAGARGWRRRLDAHGAGEKTWGRSLTLGRRLFFTTWQPLPPAAEAPCGPPRGLARLYTLAIADGQPLAYVDDAPAASRDLPGEAPPPPLVLAAPARDGPACPGCGSEHVLRIGDTAIPTGVDGAPVKTSWRRLERPE